MSSVIDTSTQSSSRASLPIDYNKRLMLFSGRAKPASGGLTSADKLGVDLGPVTLRTFSNGEVYCRYEESIRGADVFHRAVHLRKPADRHHGERFADGAAVHDRRRPWAPPHTG